jgi:hypothetical protein
VKPHSGPSGTFWSAYSANFDEMAERVIKVDPVAMAISVMMK